MAQQEQETIHVHIRHIPVKVYEKIKALAAADDRSASWLIRKALAEFVNRRP